MLRELIEDAPGSTVSIGYIAKKLRRRSYGGMFIVLSAIGLLPGVSVLAGIAMIFPAAQLALGYKTPKLPKYIRNYTIAVKSIHSIVRGGVTWLEKIEQFVKPRMNWFCVPLMHMLTGVIVIALALVMTIPIPLSNLMPAIAIVFLSLGMIEKDGLMVAIGLLVSAIALALGVTVISAATIWLVGHFT